MAYKVVLEAFEGPFDLLFHLIEKSEIDIYDIPISEITEQYLLHLKKMKELDLDVTSEFLLMAATLLEIKSKMLLPKKEKDEENLEEEIDPREELVKKLLEYKKYKELAKELRNKEEIQLKVYYKPKEEITDFIVEEQQTLEGIEILDLIKAFEQIIKRHNIDEEKLLDEIQREEITIEESMDKIIKKISNNKKIKFTDLFEENTIKSNIIITFLAVLELNKLKIIKIKQDKNFGIIFLCENDD